MTGHIKFEVKNEKNNGNLVKPYNNAKHDILAQKRDNLSKDRVRFQNNIHTVIVPTHHSHSRTLPKTLPKNGVKHFNEIVAKSDPKHISKILTVNDTNNDFVIQIKNDTKHRRRSDIKNGVPIHSTLSKAESKTSLRSDHRILIKADSKSTLRSADSKNDLKSLSGTLPRHASNSTLKSNNLGKPLHKCDSKATLRSETISTTDIPSGSTAGSTHAKKSLESMTDEEIIEENLKELLENKNREERKANGRLIAVIVAFLVIFVGLYNMWLKKANGLAGILVPAIIMVSYGGWVVLLAKRDKQRQVLYEKHVEEVMERNKIELAEKARLLRKKKQEEAQRKEKEKKEKAAKLNRLGHRPSFREKLFGTRTPALQPSANLLTIAVTAAAPSQIVVESKKKRLERMDALVLPHPPIRTGSAP
ncbi:uncharacterized protein LOC105210032 [Zeugodacus cucurbitae]|nr:uncharacterized protein LOC105210032 [Zeugodacus cucurbitae]